MSASKRPCHSRYCVLTWQIALCVFLLRVMLVLCLFKFQADLAFLRQTLVGTCSSEVVAALDGVSKSALAGVNRSLLKDRSSQRMVRKAAERMMQQAGAITGFFAVR